MKQRFKILALLLAILLFASCVSCSLPKTPASDIEGAGEEENLSKEENNPYKEKLNTVESWDFKGEKFRIATDSTSLIVSPNNTSFVGKEQYLRNAAIEEKFNIKLTLTDDSGLPTIADRIKTEALAGTDYCDLVILQSTQLQFLAANDCLINVRSVPFLNLNSSGVFADSLSATTLGAYTYGFSGNLIYQPDSVFGVFFNKKLLSLTNLPDIYQLVRDNQWDFDNFLLYADEVYSLGRIDDIKTYGFASTASSEDLIKAFWAATGNRFLDNTYGQRPQLIYQNDDTAVFIRQMQEILFRSDSYFRDHAGAVQNFNLNATLFLIAPLSKAEEITGQGINWGLVPMPKFDINQQNFYSYMEKTHCLAGFVKGTKNLEMSGIVTSALFSASDNFVNETYTVTYLNQYLQAPEDAEMLSRILSSPYYDPVEFFGQMDASFVASTQTLLYRTISSEGEFKTLYAQYQKMLNKYLDSKL